MTGAHFAVALQHTTERKSCGTARIIKARAAHSETRRPAIIRSNQCDKAPGGAGASSYIPPLAILDRMPGALAVIR